MQEADGRRCCVKEEGVWEGRSGEVTGSEHRPPTRTPQRQESSGPPPANDSQDVTLDLSVCVHFQDTSGKSCLE